VATTGRRPPWPHPYAPAGSLSALLPVHREEKQLRCSAIDLAVRRERRQSRERGGGRGREREGEVHTHYLEPAKECALAASAIVGCSTLGFASRPSARTLTMDPAEEGAGSERRSATTTEVGVEEAQAELHGGAHGDS
jgi:hypothetical protein